MSITLFGYTIPVIILFWLLVRMVESFQKSALEKKIAEMNPQEREKLKADILKKQPRRPSTFNPIRPRTFSEKFAAVVFWGILGILFFVLMIAFYFRLFVR